MHALADCIKAIQGMTGKARPSQAMQDLQHIVDATKAHLQAHSNKFEEIITPERYPQHAMSSKCAGTTKRSQTPYQ
jgi:hypothetical protein